MILQTHTFYYEIISIGFIFSSNSNLIYFLSTSLYGVAFYIFNYPLCLFSSYLNYAFGYFNQISANIYLMYPSHVKEL